YVSHQRMTIPTVGRSQTIKPVKRYGIHVMRALDVRQRHVAEGVLCGRGGHKACYLDAGRVPDAICLPTRGISLVDTANVVDVNVIELQPGMIESIEVDQDSRPR